MANSMRIGMRWRIVTVSADIIRVNIRTNSAHTNCRGPQATLAGKLNKLRENQAEIVIDPVQHWICQLTNIGIRGFECAWGFMVPATCRAT
jgi:hypothetical protein